MAKRQVLLGHIAGAHGIRGEVLIKSHTAEPEGIGAYGPLTDETGTRTFTLRVVRVTAKGVIARIAGVCDRTAAETLSGLRLYVDRDRLPAAADGEFYHEDLIGLEARDANGDGIGEVVGVHCYGAGDLLEIRMPGRRQTELIPFTSAFVPTVDVAGRQVTVIVPSAAPDEDDD